MMKLSVLMLLIAVSATVGSGPDTSCLNQLVPCVQYLNSTSTPSSSCCDPLKSVIRSNLDCLCNLLRSPPANTAGVNVSQALLLPQKCGENVSPSNCTSSPPKTTTNTNTTQKNAAAINTGSKTGIMIAFSAAISLALGSL